SVVVGRDEVSCGAVVMAMGPWSGSASGWVGTELAVRPLKGQILRLKIDGAPLPHLSWEGSYATTKPDGLVWIGTTEENAGFDATPTAEARESILRSAVAVLPYLANAQVVQHTACLRPVAPDGLPILGHVQGKSGVVVATAAGRKGILLGPAIGRLTADLLTRGETDMDISSILAFAQGTIVEFEKGFDQEIELHVSGRTVAKGYAVKVGENYGIRVSYIGDLGERIVAMAGDSGPDAADSDGGEPA
ncbi:MAG: FAD-dependent oxidoreductase, partial [Gemmatimonadetes bacterium]|nr:FAD-dependent oxidoreductase [Gemmatimonadota bacterium]